jgi:type IX secretion system PorP/SprF family membrane protein
MKKLFAVIALFICLCARAQQIPHLSQWSSHQFAINPAHTGIKQCLEAQSTLRGQWINADGAPVTGWVTVSAPLNARRRKLLSARHGLGGSVVYDQIGPFRQLTASLSYAGHFNFSIDNRLSLGLSFGATQLAFDLDAARPLTPDPKINGSGVELQPAATFGAWWNGRNYYAGLALYQLVPQKWKEIGVESGSSVHGMVNGGFRLPLSESWTLLPALYAGFAPAAPIDLQLQAMIDYRGRFSTGLGFRNTDAAILFVGYRFEERWKVMYSFDYVLSPMRAGTFHTHEITIGFSPCKALTSDQQLCPLFE